MSANTQAARGWRLLTSSSERDRLVRSMVAGGPAGGLYYGATGDIAPTERREAASAAAAEPGSVAAPTASYDVSDALVLGARRLAASQATRGFGLADTFLTRKIGGPEEYKFDFEQSPGQSPEERAGWIDKSASEDVSLFGDQALGVYEAAMQERLHQWDDYSPSEDVSLFGDQALPRSTPTPAPQPYVGSASEDVSLFGELALPPSTPAPAQPPVVDPMEGVRRRLRGR